MTFSNKAYGITMNNFDSKIYIPIPLPRLIDLDHVYPTVEFHVPDTIKGPMYLSSVGMCSTTSTTIPSELLESDGSSYIDSFYPIHEIKERKKFEKIMSMNPLDLEDCKPFFEHKKGFFHNITWVRKRWLVVLWIMIEMEGKYRNDADINSYIFTHIGIRYKKS